MSDGRRIAISLIVPGMVNREDVADGAMPGVSPQRPSLRPEARLRGPGADYFFFVRRSRFGAEVSLFIFDSIDVSLADTFVEESSLLQLVFIAV